MRQRGRELPAQPVHRRGPVSSRAPARGGPAPVCSLMVAALSLVVRLLVLLVAGRAGEALLAGAARHGALLQVHVHVALEVGHQAEGLAALGAAVALHLGVHLQRVRVGEGLQAQGAVVQVLRVRLFVVEERAGVAVGASAQVAPAAIG